MTNLNIIKILQKYIFADGDIWIIYDLKKMYDELLPIINTTDMEDKIIAYEWHNEATGHCYVDYIAHSSMDEINGYVKTPLYKAEDVNYITGHGLDKLINQELDRRIKQMMPSEEEIKKEAENVSSYDQTTDAEYPQIEVDVFQLNGFLDGAEWLRSRLISSLHKEKL